VSSHGRGSPCSKPILVVVVVMSMMIDETTNNGNINIYSLQLRLYNVYYSLEDDD
jgi:hypothetical protein